MYYNQHANHCYSCNQENYYSTTPYYDGGYENQQSMRQSLFPLLIPPILNPIFGSPSQGQPFPPSGPPSFGPPSGPPGQGPQGGPPTSPPPSFVPQQQVQTFAIDPGGIRRCLFRFTYVWLNNRQQFWFYPVFVGRRSITGYRWNGFRWLYFGIDLNQIQSFTCF